jgi:peptidoglycan hydrolase CwlO-like protein
MKRRFQELFFGKRKSQSLKLGFGFLVLVLLLGCFAVLAQEDCQTREECEALLKQYEEKISQYETDISKTAQQKNTLQNQITSLKSKISKLSAQINQSNVLIKDLSLQIKDTESSITKTTDKIDSSKEKLAETLRSIYEEDQKPLIEIMLSEESLSGFFDNVVALEALNSQTQELLANIKSLKTTLEGQKESLDQDKEETEKVLKVQQLQKKENEINQQEQQQLLKLTEAEYQKKLKEKQDVEKKAAEIRAQLFQMVGVAKAPTFGEALDVAKGVGESMGIRPAFLLAVISQESAIGRNVGQCILTDATTGAGKRISNDKPVSKLMKPSRDIQPFMAITAALGRDPYNTAVSCPLSIGYGGAMGPAQFIPSTWKLYADEIEGQLGRPGDPWAILDSFTAAGIYLADLSVKAKTTAKEKYAAAKYYGCSTNYECTNSYYGTQVMKRATCIQSFIDSGSMSGSCENLIF